MADWQPIESAPREDDIRVLLFTPDYEPVIGQWSECNEYWHNMDEGSGMPYGPMDEPLYAPTHWMPLPEPPNA